MVKIVTIIGARPQFIKAAAVSRAIRQYSNEVEEVIVHTGQHFDKNMSDIFFEEMDIPKPDYQLNINSLSHGAMTGRMLEQIETVLQKETPTAVMVYGDTNSTLAGALAAKKIDLKVIHVEAGLRSFNMKMPEEINRILTDRISDLLFCPTAEAVQNLEEEGFNNYDCQIFQVGDVMQDAALHYAQKAERHSGIIDELQLEGVPFYLSTVHRQENTDDPERLEAIVAALNHLHETTKVVLPLHPRTRKRLEQLELKLKVLTIPPVGYFDMVQLLRKAQLVLTDSGGVQKEAFFFDTFCITLRDQTEWVELVEHGYNLLTGASSEKILSAVAHFKQLTFKKEVDFYGGGEATNRIITEIRKLA